MQLCSRDGQKYIVGDRVKIKQLQRDPRERWFGKTMTIIYQRQLLPTLWMYRMLEDDGKNVWYSSEIECLAIECFVCNINDARFDISFDEIIHKTGGEDDAQEQV